MGNVYNIIRCVISVAHLIFLWRRLVIPKFILNLAKIYTF